MKAYKLDEYIKKFYGRRAGVKSEFANLLQITNTKLSRWIASNFVVVITDDGCHKLMSERQDLPTVVKAINSFSSSDDYPFCGKNLAFISFDTKSGEIDAVENDETGDEILFFSISKLLSSIQINALIESSLDDFQRILRAENEADGSKLAATLQDKINLIETDQFRTDIANEETTKVKIKNHTNNSEQTEYVLDGAHLNTLESLLIDFENEARSETGRYKLSKRQLFELKCAIENGVIETDYMDELEAALK